MPDPITPDTTPAASVPRLVSLDELEELWQRQVGPFLANLKQTTLQLIDELVNKTDVPILARIRQTVTETLAAALKSQETALWAQLKPALDEGGDALRQRADSLLANLRQVVALAIFDVFRVHVPEYSRWAGQRIMDYFLAGTLFCVAVVLAAVGAVLGLEATGFPRFASYLVIGGVALVGGMLLLKLRAGQAPNGGPAKDRGADSS